jgi:hypothetical protein
MTTGRDRPDAERRGGGRAAGPRLARATRRAACLAALALGCESAPPRDPAGEGGVFVLTTDFETGAFSLVDLDAGEVARNVGLTHSDAVARVVGSRVYVVNRLGQDNVTALDAADGFRVLWQRSTGPGSNPQDCVPVSDAKAYVTRLELPSVLILDPRDGTPLGELDASALADADGVPELSAGIVAGDRVVLAAGRLDRNDGYRPAARGRLAVVDPALDVVERTIELTGENPWGELAFGPDGRLLVAEPGTFGVLDGGLEAVDVATGAAGGFVVTEAELGGDVSSFLATEDGTLWLIVGSAARGAGQREERP